MSTSTETEQAHPRQTLLHALAMLEREGIIDFNGHFSVRLPGERLLINAGDSVRSRLSLEDFVEIDLDGFPTQGTRKPPMEFHIHAHIYRARSDVRAVVHAHPRWSTTLTMAGHDFAPVTMQATVLGVVPTFPKTASINTPELGRELAAYLGERNAALMQSHGVVVVGESIEQTFVRMLYLEENTHRQFLALQVGKPRVLDRQECETIGRELSRPQLLDKAWKYYCGKYHV